MVNSGASTWLSDIKERKTWYKGLLRQYLAAICASTCSLSCSAAFVWTAPLLVRLKAPDSAIPLTPDESSWVVSVIMVGMMVATVPSGFLLGRLGRKPLLLSAGLVLLLGWALVLTTRSFAMLLLIRVVHGVALGMMCASLPPYLGEIAGPKVRGTVGYFFQGMWYMGNLYQYSTAPYLDYQTIAWTSLSPCLVFLVTFIWLPESPYFLLMRGEEEAAAKSLAWLRGEKSAESVTKELETMKRSVQDEVDNKSTWRDVIGTRVGRRALTVVTLVQASYIMCGGTALFSYATDTFAKTKGSHLSPDETTIVMGCVVLAVVPLSGVVADTLGRRLVLIVSCVGSALCLAAVSVYYYLHFETDVDLTAAYWVPYLFIILYTVMIGAGVESVAPVLQAELFSNSTRALAGSLVWFLSAAMSMLCLKLYQVISDSVGLYFLYALFAVCAVLGSLYTFFFVPETKGKTFAEIQAMLAAE